MTHPNSSSLEYATWTNWSGIQQCRPARIEQSATEAEVQEAVVRAVAQSLPVRAVGAGHSFGPVALTRGVAIDPRISSEVRFDGPSAAIPGGMRLRDVLGPAWDVDLTLQNMGELDSTAVTGAVATGVHGTGITLPSISSAVSGARIVLVTGDAIEINRSSEGDLLRAAQLAVGMLGVMTEVTLDLVPAYDLVEDSFFISAEAALEQWDDLVARHRHVSFYYLPSPAAADTYALLPAVPDTIEGEICYATVRDALPVGDASTGPRPLERRDRMYRVLAYEYDVRYREIEYSVPLEEGKTVFRAVRALLRDHAPGYAHPIDVRFVAQEDALLSWAHDGPRVVFSVPESLDQAYSSVLAPMELLFIAHGGRPHWGKEYSPEALRGQRSRDGVERFLEVRRWLDPDGVFLNEQLRAFFT